MFTLLEIYVTYEHKQMKKRTTKVVTGSRVNAWKPGFYTKLIFWGSLELNFEYDGGPIIEIGGPIFLYKLRILEGSTSFREGSVLSPGQ